MNRTGRWLMVCAVSFLIFGATVADEAITLEGNFVWARDDGDRTGPLKAVFTPSGESRWTVAFHFDWEDGPHVYNGTAQGSLSGGELGGEVQNDNEERKMTFRFRGSIENGKFLGSHGSVGEDGTLKDMGTLSLTRG